MISSLSTRPALRLPKLIETMEVIGHHGNEQQKIGRAKGATLEVSRGFNIVKVCIPQHFIRHCNMLPFASPSRIVANEGSKRLAAT